MQIILNDIVKKGIGSLLRPILNFNFLSLSRAFVLPAIVLVIWEILCQLLLFPNYLVPSPTAVLSDLTDLAIEGDLETHIGITMYRVALGFSFGTIAATALASLTGYSRTARDYIDPSIQALKAVPSLAWVPIFILWFGIFEISKITLIATGVFFPVYLNLLSGIDTTDRKLVEVGEINGLNRRQMLIKILLPSTLPSYFTGLRSGLALGWMFVIAAELMGASQGLGFLMLDGQMTGRPSIIVGALILFAFAGKITDAFVVAIGKRFLIWRDDNYQMQEKTNA